MRKIKKITGTLLISSIIFSNVQSVSVFAHEVNTQSSVKQSISKTPQIFLSTLAIDKTEVKAGESVKLSIRGDEQTGLESVIVKYRMPKTKKYHTIELKRTAEHTFEATLNLTERMESGLWQIYSIEAKGKGGTSKTFYNSKLETKPGIRDLSKGDFTLTGTNEVIIGPSIYLDSLNVEQTTEGTVKVSIKVEAEESAIKTVGIQYITNESRRTRAISLRYNKETGMYEGKINVKGLQKGLWEVSRIAATDIKGNSTNLYNKKFVNRFGAIDINVGGFKIK